MRSRRQAIVVAAIIVALAVAVVALAQLNRSDADVATGSIAVTRSGEVLRTFSMEEIEALPATTSKKTIRSASHADETGEFTGTRLADVLREADPAWSDSASAVITRAADGFVSSLDADEVAEGDGVLLVYAKDGDPLGSAKDGGTGPFRIIILADPFGNRCTRWVNEIEIR